MRLKTNERLFVSVLAFFTHHYYPKCAVKITIDKELHALIAPLKVCIAPCIVEMMLLDNNDKKTLRLIYLEDFPMAQQDLIIESTKPGASSLIFRDNARLSSFDKGWKGIDFEHHYQNPASIPEYKSTELVIAVGHSPMEISRRLAGEFRQESTQIY
jgi:hypothetical protein